MIDFSKYTLQELQAIVEVLDRLSDDMAGMSNAMAIPLTLAYYGAAKACEGRLVYLQARDAAEPAGDPPAPPDMFGWVGDALDDLCAAGEVIGNER